MNTKATPVEALAAGAPPMRGCASLIVIGVASYRRRQRLCGLLQSLQAQTGLDQVHVEILVVDNSPDFELADLDVGEGRLPVTLISEPEPGISAARNKILEVVRARGAAFLAFIDDDERADPDWLSQLLVRQRETNADAVLGVVRGEPPADAPVWMGAARVFDGVPPDNNRSTGAGATCNILVRVAATHGLNFDPDFGLTGGEDTYFFAQMHKRGARFERAWTAIVREPTARERAKLSWLLRRWTREAISESEVELRLREATPVGLFVRGAVRLAAGAGLALAVAPFSGGAQFGRCARNLRIAARGVGFLLGALRLRIYEYRR